MSRLILVRHGQTDWNLNRKILSWQDIPLNQEGLRQARVVSQKLGREIFDVLYSSTLKRALQTAHIIAGDYGLDIIKDERLNEINQGDWEGLHDSEALQKYPGLYKQWLENPASVKPPNGESLQMLAGRVEDFLNMVEEKYPAQSICVVTHEMVIGAFMCLIENIDLPRIREMKTPNAQIKILNHSIQESCEKS